MVEELLITPDRATQARRQSEGSHEVGDRQEHGLLLIDPSVDLIVLALGAVTVLAGVVLVVLLVALGAAVQMTAEGLGAAIADVCYSPPVAG